MSLISPPFSASGERLSRAFGGCTCHCHRHPSVFHCIPCCTPGVRKLLRLEPNPYMGGDLLDKPTAEVK